MRYLISFVLIITSYIEVHALYISEIMYDPSGSDTSREWIEVYNDSGSSINLTTWKFLENGTNHGITSNSGGDIIPPNGYAIVADNAQKFLVDYPNYQGVLYDSAFSLSNTGEALVMKNAGGAAEDSITYDVNIGGSNDGTTLSRINSIWVKGDATPGAENRASTAIVTETGGNATTTTTSSVTTDTQAGIPQMSPPTADIVLYLPNEKMAVAGADTEFNAYSTTRAGKMIDNMRYSWAFGDGGQGVGATTTHTFAYPGKYLLHLFGTNSYIAGDARMVVHVVLPDITIVGFGAGKYGSYVDISNPNAYEIDMSQGSLVIEGVPYPFPKFTTLLPHSTTRFSGSVMGFGSKVITSNSVIKILFPNLEEVTRYVQPFVTNSLGTTTENNAISGKVLGVSTTTATATVVVKTPVKKTAIVVKKKTPAKSSATTKTIATTTPFVATSTVINETAQPATSSQVIASSQKDTRIVSFLRSLFGSK